MGPLFVLGLVAAAPPAHLDRFAVGPRAPFGVVTLTPPGTELEARTGELVMRVEALLEPRLRVDVRSAEQMGLDLDRIDACEAQDRVRCVVREVSAAAPPFVLALALQRRQDSDRVLPLFIDVEAAKAASGEDADALFLRAVVAASGFRPIAELEQAIEALFADGVATRLAARGLAEPYHRTTIALPAPRIAINVDGRRLGVTSSTVCELIDLPPGARELTVVDPSGAFATRVERFDAATTPRLALELLRVDTFERSANEAAAIAGLGLAATGVALVIVAAAGAPSATVGLPCTGDACPGTRSSAASFCEVFGDPAGCGPGGVAVWPLGLSLGVGGAGVALSAWLWGDEQQIPWLGYALSVALGAGSYAVAASL